MPNKIKYNSTGSEADSLFKGNWAIDVTEENTGGGPSSTTGFYMGAEVPIEGYVVYYSGSVFTANTDIELLEYINTIGGDSGSVESALEWAVNAPEVMILNRQLEKIPTEGLKLYLDSRNTSSYTGGSTWYDLMQGIKFNRYGEALPVLDILGDPGFEFNSSGYWQSESGHELVDMGGETTLLMWVNSGDITERDTIFEKAGIQYQSYEHEIAVTWETSENFSWYSRKTQYGYGSTSSIGQSGWHLVGIKMSTGKEQGVARRGWWSIDGSTWQENYTDRGANAILPAGPIRIGTGYAGAVETGGISVVAVYDRQLNNEEISQVWNNQKTYFGL